MGNEPPNGWQLDKRLALMEQQLTIISKQVEMIPQLHDELVAERARRKTFVWAVSFLSSITGILGTWAKMTFWGNP